MSKFEKPRKRQKPASAHGFALHCTVTRAVRSVPAFAAGAPGILVLITPEGKSPFDYVKAITTALHGSEVDYLGRDLGFMCIVSKDRPEKSIGEFETECRDKHRAIVIAESKDIVPTVISLAADATVDIPPIVPTDFRAACHCVLKIDATEAQATEALSYPDVMLWSALRVGRPMDDTLRRLKEATEAQQDAVASRARSNPVVRLEEMPGYGQAKDWGLQLAADLAQWRNGELNWSDVDRGLLLSGPPGVGKTQFARSLAASCDSHFIASSLGQWQARGHLGDLLKAMRADFDAARQNAPSIIFLDELDSVGDRDTFTHEHASYSVQVVNCLLECIDGVAGREGVIVVGATNNPSRIDPALRRAGRLDKHVIIGMPDEGDRVAILAHHLGTSLPPEQLKFLGPQMEGMSGADIEQLARQARRIARREQRAVTVDDLKANLPALIPIDGFYRQTVSVHEAGHVIAADQIGYGELVDVFVARQLSPRIQEQQAGAAAFRYKPISFRDRQSYLDEICTNLAGIAAEQVIFGRHGDGSGVGSDNDLRRATRLAYLVEGNFGMGDGLRFIEVPLDGNSVHGDRQLSRKVDQVLSSEFERAKTILSEQRPLLEALSKELQDVGRVSAERFGEIRRKFIVPKETALAS
ncbi:AAA family ATPase [Neorhizobium galegae]|uniref:AAA family ATPase n=1 Tax=Neorhizobium galegae TaxID=399 RepID=UPI00127705AC|nr:AAA family ATPase [Neorhizobium galegae]KAA9387728.1 AAA family ATPase [Neorhizobium galegae]MCM2501958.1 AAA family ATPase [Neorhizobium galegae]MCQ1772913.1 AAA family ATPase [Neorhizobium galegae]MCQ1799417.1 AAA family ATPase [Neorhizobium galegae]